MKKFKKALPILLVAAVSAVAGVTGATVLHKMSLTNTIKTPPVTGEIVESINQHVKRTQFKNTGEADVFLRVAYVESWETADGEALPLETEINTGSRVEVKPVAIPYWNETVSSDWIKGNDGWLYYTKVLKAKQSTPVLLYKVDFSNALNVVDEKLKAKYCASEKDAEGKLIPDKGTKYDIHFVMEIVQASDETEVNRAAIKEMFGEKASEVIVAAEDLKYTETFDKGRTLKWPGSSWSPSYTTNVLDESSTGSSGA